MLGLFDDNETAAPPDLFVGPGLPHMGGADPGVRQQEAIAASHAESRRPDATAEANNGLQGIWHTDFTGDAGAPQIIPRNSYGPENWDAPPAADSAPMLPGRIFNPAGTTGETGEDQLP